MSTMPIHKYQQAERVDLPDRRWPGNIIDKAPTWCSVDLRDGNQALVEPMGSDKKLRFYHHLLDLGFKEIEVGFPAASDTDFEFVRHIIENDLVPDDVFIQVLTQSREELITKTIESLKGAKNAIIHLYNSTSELQRRVVFGQGRDGIKQIATDGGKMIRDQIPQLIDAGTNVRLEYSPESFTGTELDYALEVCHAMMDVWQPTAENPVIFNLPATVEMAPPNYYADQIEWMHRNFREREKVILSIHPHNDRGTGVAATEQAIMAGADRVEGTLFGNGERTGNVDVVTLALNMFTQGVDPSLDFSDIEKSMEIYQSCNQLPIHPRHPYAGELVYTAFSGSHQDAIKKGMSAIEKSNSEKWEVPYLPIDPMDVGRSYEAIIRVNSQSGKGGVAYILETEFGVELPKEMQAEFSKVIQKIAEETGKEILPQMIWDTFQATYLDSANPYEMISYRLNTPAAGGDEIICSADIRANGQEMVIEGEGNGPINAFVKGLRESCDLEMKFLDYHQHALGTGSAVQAVCIVKMQDTSGQICFGAGIHENTNTASLRAIVSAANRLYG